MGDGSAAAQTQPIKPSATNICPPKRKSSLEETLDRVLKTYSPTVISFGEIHRDCTTTPPSPKIPTLERFAKTILPILTKHGIKDVILELLLDDPQINKELKHYFSTEGSLNEAKTPFLMWYSRQCRFEGFETLLKEAKRLGIELHPGAPTKDEIKGPEIQKEKKERGKEWRPKASQLVAEVLWRNIEQLTQQGKRVAVLSGLWHNDMAPFVPESSFGDEAVQKHKGKYVEFDLLIRPQMIALIKSPQGAPPYPPLQTYKKVSSPNRNVCYSPSPNHFVFILKE